MSATLNRRNHVVAMIAAVLVSFGVISTAQAQQQSWGQDNCLYVWNGVGWVRDGNSTCRRFPFPNNPNIWDTYSMLDPYHRNQDRVDFSNPQWVTIQNHNTKALFAQSKSDPRVVYTYLNGQWLNQQQLAGLAAQEQQEANRVEQARQVQLATPYTDPPCLRGRRPSDLRPLEQIDSYPACRTAAENRVWREATEQAMLDGQISHTLIMSGQQRAAQQKDDCERARDSGQFDDMRQGANYSRSITGEKRPDPCAGM